MRIGLGFNRTCAGLLLALAASGCGSTEPEQLAAGRYDLSTINGTSLPYVFIQEAGSRAEHTAGYFQVNADATFSHSLTTRWTYPEEVISDTVTMSGEWSQSDDQVLFTSDDGKQVVAIVSSTEIELEQKTVINGIVISDEVRVYRRR